MVNYNAPPTTIVRTRYSSHYRSVMPRLHTGFTEWQRYLMLTISHMTKWKLVVNKRQTLIFNSIPDTFACYSVISTKSLLY